MPRAAIKAARRFFGATSGTAAAEFAMIIPLMVMLTIGLFNMCLLVYAENALHFSVERTARCVSVTPASCGGVQSYGASQYSGPTITPIYALTAATDANCGNTVSATGTFTFMTGVSTLTVPLSATACYARTS